MWVTGPIAHAILNWNNKMKRLNQPEIKILEDNGEFTPVYDDRGYWMGLCFYPGAHRISAFRYPTLEKAKEAVGEFIKTLPIVHDYP
jgi:hypothetical protein